MSNIYFVTLSYNTESADHYTNAITRVTRDTKNSKILLCHQMGKTGTHPHYHILLQTDTDCIRKFRMRFRTYMSPIKPDKINLDIKHAEKPGVYLNYFRRDPSSKLTNVKDKEWNMTELEAQARAIPDPGPQRQELPWTQVHAKLKFVGWKYPEPPGKYLKSLSKDWYVYHIITNPKRLAQILRFEESADDWDDIYKHANNQLVF